MVTATRIIAESKPKSWFVDNLEKLAGSIVHAPPMIGHDLVAIPVNVEGAETAINFGCVLSTQIEDAGGRRFRVMTDMLPTENKGNAEYGNSIIVELIDGATSHLSNQRL